IDPCESGFLGIEKDLEPALACHLAEDRGDPLDELGLELLLQLVQLGLCILLEALTLDLLSLDFLLELAAGRVTHDAAARRELVLIRLELLRLLSAFVLLFLAQGLNARGRGLAVGRFADDALEVDEPDFGTLRK